MKKTMKELAILTGYSPATISRVLTRNKNVNAATRLKVEEALKAINYTPTRVNRKKYARKSVMVISGETSSKFHTRLFTGISSALLAQGYYVLVGHTGFDKALEERYVEYAHAQEFCGIIMITPMDSPQLTKLLAESPCPVVLVNRYLRSVDVDAVYMDNHRAGYLVGKHLVDMGHRRIACLAGDDHSTAIVDRVAGFSAALADAGLPADSAYIWQGDLKAESGREFGQVYADRLRDYTAVFCLNEPMAEGFVESVMERGLSIPRDVSVICIAPMVVTINGTVKLSCVIHNAELLSSTAVTMLMDRLEGQDPAPRKIVYPPQLSVRDSVKALDR